MPSCNRSHCERSKSECNQKEPVYRPGIEYTRELHWSDWKCGDEVCKDVVLRNTTTEVIRVQYKLPEDRQFVVGFPKPLKLYPGIPLTVKVASMFLL